MQELGSCRELGDLRTVEGLQYRLHETAVNSQAGHGSDWCVRILRVRVRVSLHACLCVRAHAHM